MAFKKDYYEKITAKCIEDPVTGCWNWQGKARHVQGYGFARHNGKMKTIQRGMAEELKLFPNMDFFSRISNSCENKLCVRPSHVICMSHSETNFRRWKKSGRKGMFNDESAKKIRDEYNDMKVDKIPKTIEIMAEKYNCSPAHLYRTIERARG